MILRAAAGYAEDQASGQGTGRHRDGTCRAHACRRDAGDRDAFVLAVAQVRPQRACLRSGLSLLDLIARQVLWLREEEGSELPLLLMNSFRTRDACLAALNRDSEIEGRTLRDFFAASRATR